MAEPRIKYRNSWSDRDVEAHWDRVADIYIRENEKVKKTHDQRFRESITYLELSPGNRVLNISSRDAEASDYILEKENSAEVINAEISARLMEVARKVRPDTRQVKIGSYSTLPFHDREFDRVLSLETLEHVAEPIVFLEELKRVMKDDGRMVLSCPPATSELPYLVYTALFGGHGEGPHRFPSSRKVKKMMKEAGWKVLLHKGTLLVPVGPAWAMEAGEKLIERCQGTCIAEFGIRQFYVCEKAD